MRIVGTTWARIFATAPARLAFAFLATLVALLVGRTLNPSVDGTAPYITTLAAVAFSAWCCGTGPSIATVALSVLGLSLWIIPGSHSPRMMHTADGVNLFIFLLVAVAIVAIGEANRRERKRLRNAAGELEEKVRERTGQLELANLDLRELSARLLNLQDEERRRIARELHDNAGQALSALAMNLDGVTKDLERLTKTTSMAVESASLVHQMSDDIRTMSYLLHPPLLDETGLAPALQWYIEGFAKRSKIATELECPEDLGRLSRELETAIFRLVQESLTNIHRHSRSATAAIRIARSDGFVHVEVRDTGKGISPDERSRVESGGAVGVGIRGMRERVRQLGGKLEISSDGVGQGTRVVARVPCTEITANESAARAAAAGEASVNPH